MVPISQFMQCAYLRSRPGDSLVHIRIPSCMVAPLGGLSMSTRIVTTHPILGTKFVSPTTMCSEGDTSALAHNDIVTCRIDGI